MSLSLESRHCGRVFVIKCAGRIVTGEEITILEACISRGLLESRRIVLHLGEVTRVDSTGMGLLVRFLSHTRNRGGDLRLAAPPLFLDNLLRLTKLTTIFRIYDSEDEAIVSFLKESAVSYPAGTHAGPLVLFVDQSPDLCAFVRTLLQHHGYEVLSTCRLHDAKTLLDGCNRRLHRARSGQLFPAGGQCGNFSEVTGAQGLDRPVAKGLQTWGR